MQGLRKTFRNFTTLNHPSIRLSVRASLSRAPRLVRPVTLKVNAAQALVQKHWRPGLFKNNLAEKKLGGHALHETQCRVDKGAQRRVHHESFKQPAAFCPPYNWIEAKRFSTAVEVKQNAFDRPEVKLEIKNYLLAVVVKVSEVKKTDFAKVTITAESKKQLEFLAKILDKLTTQINNFYSNPDITQSTITQHTDFLRFTLSHLEAVDYHFKKLLGKSVFVSNSGAILSELIENGSGVLNKLKEHIAKPIPQRKRATVLSTADNHQLEIKRFEEQQQYSTNPDFTALMNRAWEYSVENRHRTKKIFISYAWPEKNSDHKEEWSQQLVIQLVKDLTRMGYQVFLDKNHSGAGFLLGPFMEKIQQVDHVLLISTRTMGDKLTKAESGVNFEHSQIMACLKQYPDLINRRFVVPVLLNNSKYCHKEFSDIAEVSICKEGYLNALESLVTHIYDAGEIEFRAWWKSTVEDVLHQRVVFNPPPIDPYAVQRHDLFDEVFIKLKTLTHTARTSVTLACVGLPGTGKTHLLRQFFHDQKRKYYIAAWFNAENRDTLVTAYRQFASQEHLNLLKGKELSDFKDEEIIKLVREKLAQTPESLLVYDNAESLPLIEELMPAYGHHHILISSRQRVWPHMVEVDRMSEDEGCQLIHNMTKLLKDDVMLKLVKELDCIPLALSHAAAYMQIKYISCQHYLDKYLADKAKLLSAEIKMPSLAHDHLSVWITWQHIFNLLNKAHPEMARALKILSLLDAENIPNLLLEQILAYQNRQDRLENIQKTRSVVLTAATISFLIGVFPVTFPQYPITTMIFLLSVAATYGNLSGDYYTKQEKFYTKFIPSEFNRFQEIRTTLIGHAAVIPDSFGATFSIHRLVKDMLCAPISVRQLSPKRTTFSIYRLAREMLEDTLYVPRRVQEALPILTGVWAGLSAYYKMLKSNQAQDGQEIPLWSLLLHFKAANNIVLAREVNQHLENKYFGLLDLVGGIDPDDIRKARIKVQDFRKKYEEFLDCYKQLCQDIKQDELANGINNKVFQEWSELLRKSGWGNRQDAKKDEPSNQNTPKPPRP